MRVDAHPASAAEQRLGLIRHRAHEAVVDSVRARLDTVRDVSAALPDILAEVMLALDCQSVVVAVLDPAGERFDIVAQVGMDSSVMQQWRWFPADAPVPARDAVASSSIVLLTSVDERDARYPAFAGVAAPRGTYATVPMRVANRNVGAITFAWQRVRTVDPVDELLLRDVSSACGEALLRSRTP